jgi:hypothetical protein
MTDTDAKPPRKTPKTTPDKPPALKAATLPAAGPHARPELVNEEATPGAGALPSDTARGGDVDGGTG